MKKKQIYLFACIEKNIGDDLFVYIICQRYPNVDFIISDAADYLKVNSISNLKYSSKLRKWLRYANYESDSLIKRSVVALIGNIYRLKLKRMNSIYIVGNAFKNMNYKGKYQINWLNRRISLSKKFFLISTNYGPSNSNEWRKICYKAFSKMTDVCFRDTNSYELFNDLENVRYAPDAVLSLNLNNISSNNNLFNSDNYIIISVIDCLMEGRNEKLKKAANNYEEKMISIINDFNKNGVEIVILNSNAKQDELASKRIFDKCVYKDKISIYNYDGNLNRIFSLFYNAKAVIATRLHTIILGWIFDIPVIPIVYDIKVDNLLKSYMFNGLKREINDLDDLDYLIINEYIEKNIYKIPKNVLIDSNNQFKKIDEFLK